MTRRITLGLLVGALWLLPASPASAQTDPKALQARAIARIDVYIDTFRKTGDRESRLPDMAQADAELAASNQALLAQSDWTALALGLTKRGHIYRLQGQFAQAVALYTEAENAARRGGNPGRQSDALAYRGLAGLSLRNVGQAFADATQAVRLAETADDVNLLASALDVLGAVQATQLDLTAAADTVNRQVAVAAQATDRIAPYFAYLNRSDVYQKLGQRCDYQRSFAPCYQAFERARADMQQARSIATAAGFMFFVQMADELLSGIDARVTMTQSQERLTTSMQSARIFNARKASDVLVTSSFVSPPGPIPAEVEQVYAESKQLGQRFGQFADASLARMQYTEGIMHELRGENDAALASFTAAVGTLERDRQSLRDERSRGTFLEDRIGLYYAAIGQLLEHGRHAEALDMLERSRSRALADLLASRTLGLSRPEEQKLYAESAVLRTRIAEAQGRLFEMASGPGGAANASRLQALQTQIRTLEEQDRQVAARMAIEAPRLQNLLTSTPPGLQALQASIRAERYEVLQYLVLESGVIVWHITADSVIARNVFLPRSELIDKVASIRTSLADRNVAFNETTAQELFLYLIEPVLSGIRGDRLVIIPHEDLQYVPFQVFRNPVDGKYLGERFQISYAPSLTVLLGFKRAQNLAGGKLLAVADPSIAVAGQEVDAIARLFPATRKTVTDALATERDVKTWMRDFDVIHLSVHGKFNSTEPMLSYLSLASGGGDDGRLTAAEMFGLPLDQSRVVVLSACETGRAEATHANEILGMVRALIYAGAGTLLLSHWEVDSDATALWMRTFYETARTRPLPEAARAALVAVRSTPRFSHPYYWAAFVMVGR